MAALVIICSSRQAPQGCKLWSLLPMGVTYCAKLAPYYTIDIYCTEVRLSFGNHVTEDFESTGEWSFSKEKEYPEKNLEK